MTIGRRKNEENAPAEPQETVREVQTNQDPAADKQTLSGKVTEILDYGRTVYARIAVGSQTVMAPYAGKRGDAVSLAIDQSRLSVVDREAEIIIV